MPPGVTVTGGHGLGVASPRLSSCAALSCYERRWQLSSPKLQPRLPAWRYEQQQRIRPVPAAAIIALMWRWRERESERRRLAARHIKTEVSNLLS